MTVRRPPGAVVFVVFVVACAGPGARTDLASHDAPRLGPEIVVSSRAVDEEEDPVPSWNGSRFLVVWQSTRRGPSDIFGAWVAADGAVDPSEGFPISQGPSDGLFPDVAWGGESHLAVWQDLRGRRSWQIYGARVRPDGTVLDPDGLAVGAGPGNRRHPRLAWSGRVYLASWMQERANAGWDIVATRIAPDGRVLDPEGIVVGGGAGDQTRAAVAWNGRTFVVAWMDTRRGDTDLFAARVDDEGLVLDPSAIAVSTAAGEQGYPAVGASASSNGASVIVWVDKRGGGPYALYGATLDPDGRVAQPDGVALSSTPRLHMFPAAACRGHECLIVWEEEQPSAGPMTKITDITRDVRALRWTGGAPAAPFTVEPDSRGNHFTTVAAGGPGYLVAWKDYRTGRAESLARVIEFPR